MSRCWQCLRQLRAAAIRTCSSGLLGQLAYETGMAWMLATDVQASSVSGTVQLVLCSKVIVASDLAFHGLLTVYMTG